ncbi:MAG: hypothetical protein ACRD2X_16530 [Vicinamibacteraceae bacterium]
MTSRLSTGYWGSEAPLVDHAPTRLQVLDPDDRRVFEVRVAGPSALLVAKVHKLPDRSAERGATRLKDKNALDVLRLLRAIPVEVLARGLGELFGSPIAREVTAEACEQLRVLFGTTVALGIAMAVRATERLEDPAVVAESCVALSDELLDALRA